MKISGEIKISNEVMQAVELVIRERFKDKVETVRIKPGYSDIGEVVLMIEIMMNRGVTADDFSGKFFGLTGRVRSALGDEMQDVFPVIRPVEAHA
jgi:hypothetical protein